MEQRVKISYFSDVLCVWAYVAKIRLDELKRNFSDSIKIEYHHVTLFGDTTTRLAEGWKERGGYKGFNQHVIEVAENFKHVEVNPDIWLTSQPLSSAVPHLFLKAVKLWSDQNFSVSENKLQQDSLFEKIDWQVRLAFFRDNIDISQMKHLYEIAESNDIPVRKLQILIDNGKAMSMLCRDMSQKELNKLDGSPTYLLNENRQKLFGNVGYKILEANVIELLNKKQVNQASWC